MTDLTASRHAHERAQQSLAGGVSSGLRAALRPHPLFIEKAQGSRVWDVSGSEFVDYAMGWGPLIAGHSHPDIIGAVAAVLPRMQMLGMGHALEYEAAEAVLAVVPGADRLLWSNTGTEAVQTALRLGRAATGRNRIVKFLHSYHGWHDSVFASVAFHEGGEAATPNSAGQNPNAIKDLIVLPFNDMAAVEHVLAEAAERDIAAVLIDPVQSNSGLIAPAPGFLERIRELCDRHGVVLIFDQVIAGFRVALGGAAERYGVVPDLSVFGKAIAGGFAQAAVAGRSDLVDAVTRDVLHAGTYNGNPIALAAVKATLGVLTSPGTYEELDKTSALLEKRLTESLSNVSNTFTVRRIGSLLTVAEDGTASDQKLWPSITEEMVHHGVIALPTGKIFVSTAHTEADIEQFAAAVQPATASAV
jgi:glutamate-1-semialdehyde 2,1-aminomutase